MGVIALGHCDQCNKISLRLQRHGLELICPRCMDAAIADSAQRPPADEDLRQLDIELRRMVDEFVSSMKKENRQNLIQMVCLTVLNIFLFVWLSHL